MYKFLILEYKGHIRTQWNSSSISLNVQCVSTFDRIYRIVTTSF